MDSGMNRGRHRWLAQGFVTGICAMSAVFGLRLLSGGQGESEQAQEARSKAVVQKVCVSCHEMDVVIATRHTRIGWQQIVDDMISRGAEGSDMEMAETIAYLTKYFGKVNVNTASAKQLAEFLDLSGKEAEIVTQYREQHGNFKDFEQLKSVPGVNAEKLQEKRSLIAFSL
jgi:competence protein ComEA